MARLRGKPRQRINRNHTEVIQQPTSKNRRRQRLARGKPLCWVGETLMKIAEKAKIQNLASKNIRSDLRPKSHQCY